MQNEAFYAKGIEQKARSGWGLSDGRTCSDSPTRTLVRDSPYLVL
jgi:hypothetical protein